MHVVYINTFVFIVCTDMQNRESPSNLYISMYTISYTIGPVVIFVLNVVYVRIRVLFMYFFKEQPHA